MNLNFLYLQVGSLLEIAGLLTFFTNPESVTPYVDLGFEVPVLLLSADIQGAVLFLLGSALTLFTVYQMKLNKG